jgi:hypothetical protein
MPADEQCRGLHATRACERRVEIQCSFAQSVSVALTTRPAGASGGEEHHRTPLQAWQDVGPGGEPDANTVLTRFGRVAASLTRS